MHCEEWLHIKQEEFQGLLRGCMVGGWDERVWGAVMEVLGALE